VPASAADIEAMCDILSAYLISAALRLAQGSATVAIVTAGIVEPIVPAGGYTPAQIALIVIAVSAGSIIASHVNDGGFWIVATYFNMSVKDTLLTWTVLGDDPVGRRVRGRPALAGGLSGIS
jgi:GntP family gluconate:H+ symporter